MAGGELRSLADYDATIASTLPLWLRRRVFSLEISISTEGLFIFFFNLSPTALNTVCDISASLAAAGVRYHNEEIRNQLVMLGILKEKIRPPLRVQIGSRQLIQDELPVSTFPTSFSLSPIKSGLNSSSSPFPLPVTNQTVINANSGNGSLLSPRSNAIGTGIVEIKICILKIIYCVIFLEALIISFMHKNYPKIIFSL